MAKIRYKTILDSPLEKVWEAHADPYFYKKISPKWNLLIISRVDRFGHHGVFDFFVGPFLSRFQSKILFFEKNDHFTDCARKIPWPLTYWIHKHEFVPISENKCALIETIVYGVGVSWMKKFVQIYLKYFFEERQKNMIAMFKKSSQTE